MRKTTNRSRFSMAIAAALGIFVMTLGTPALALVSPVAVVATNVSGAVVNVTVKNNSLSSQIATVKVEAIVGDTPIWSFVGVALLPGQTSVAGAGFAANVSSVVKVGITCGVIDDTQPF
jgi:hypothetical protein